MKRLRCICSLVILIVSLFSIVSCGGGGHSSESPQGSNGGNNNTGTLLQPITKFPVMEKQTIGPEGGDIRVSGAAIVTISKGTLPNASEIVLEAVKSPELEQEFNEGNAGLGELQSESFQIKISGLPSGTDANKTIHVQIRLSDDLASKVGPTATPTATVWNLYSSDEEDILENTVLESQYESGSKILTVDIPIFYLSSIDPITRQQLRDLTAALRVSIFEVNPQKVSSKAFLYPKENSSQSGLSTAQLKAAQQAAVDACNPNWLSPINGFDLVVNGPFSEPGHTNNSPHGGIDFPVVKVPVRAVADGYIEKVINTNTNRNGRGGIFTLILKLNNGDRALYLHLDRNRDSLLFCNKDQDGNTTTCLKDEPNIAEEGNNWIDSVSSRNRYIVKKGDPLATSGNTGSGGRYHFHIGYVPSGLVAVQGVRNPLCRLASLQAFPSMVKFPINSPQDDIVSLRLMNGLQEYIVQRQKSPQVLLHAAAKPVAANPGDSPPNFENGSKYPMLITDVRSVDDESIATLDKLYKDESVRISTDNGGIRVPISTDNGKVRIVPGNQGSTAIHIKQQIYWNKAFSNNLVVSLGDDVVVQINNNSQTPPPSVVPITSNDLQACNVVPSTDPAYKYTILYPKNLKGCVIANGKIDGWGLQDYFGTSDADYGSVYRNESDYPEYYLDLSAGCKCTYDVAHLFYLRTINSGNVFTYDSMVVNYLVQFVNQ